MGKIREESNEGIDKKISVMLEESFDPKEQSKEELEELVGHLRYQFKNRYMYLVGEWANGKRAKSTRDGKFVSKKEVIQYLDRMESDLW